MKLANIERGTKYRAPNNLGSLGEYLVIEQHGKLTESLVLAPPKKSFWKRGAIVWCNSNKEVELSE